ncbi:hypothetical protein J5X84_19420 [Streptosporangiaceae bacterium NEAU-GS5]|nr:hypothetical protein [Streptosporangiaceae bacterium NEAU-GS5]
MPAWPNVGRADDHRLLEALRRADAHAPAALYDAYADRLSDYANFLLTDREAAAEAVHDALVTAQPSVHRLKEPTRMRAWLYALTRFQCAGRTAGTPSGRHAALSGPTDDAEQPADPEMSAVVRESLGELSRQEREVLELSLRHELSGIEVGAVLGLTSRQVAARLARAREHLENAAGAVILARVGRAHCPDLSAMLDSWDGPLTTPLRRRLSRHISGCEECREGRDRQVSAGRLLDLIPVAFPPLSLRRRVVDTCVSPEQDQTRTTITERTERQNPFDRTGFPVTGDIYAGEPRKGRRHASSASSASSASPAAAAAPAATRQMHAPADEPSERPRRKRGKAGPVIAATISVFVTAGAVTYMVGLDGTNRVSAAQKPPAPAASGTPSPSLLDDLTEDPFAGDPTDAPTDAATDEPTSDPAATTGPSQAPVRLPQSRPESRPTARATAKPTTKPNATAALTAACPGDLGSAAGGTVTLLARNGSVSWSAIATGGIVLSPKKGSLKAGATTRVIVAIQDPSSAGSGTVSFRSAGGAPSCSVKWDGASDTGGQDPDPHPDETPSSEPSSEQPSASPSANTASAESSSSPS